MLDKKYWEKLKTGPKKVSKLNSKMKELIKMFTGDDVTTFLRQQFPLVELLGSPAMKRLKNLCNALQNKFSTNNLSRELNKLYTNIIACILDRTEQGGSKLQYKDFMEAGWSFGKHRNMTARKRLREDNYVDVTPTKRGRQEISNELKERHNSIGSIVPGLLQIKW